MLRFLFIAVASAAAGCASESIQLAAAPGQESIVRDGLPSLHSKKTHLVMLRPNMRLVKASSRPAFTLAVSNLSNQPEFLSEAAITAWQSVDGERETLRVYKYDELVQEEKTRQAVAAFGAALSGMARAYNAANAGYVNTTGSVRSHTPYGGTSYATYSATTYDPLRASLAQNAANSQTQHDFAALRAQGEQNLAQLQNTILKDNTVMPGEWIGGTIVLEAPHGSTAESKTYTIVVAFGGETHEFSVAQVKN